MIESHDVLIVEDELLIAAQLEEALSDLGCTPHCAGSLDHALRMVEERAFDAAFLDMNLRGEACLPIADALATRQTPFMFMSGYGSADVRNAYAGVPVLSKPFSEREIERALARLLASRP
jgi:CheY-like chemotaxis protein